MTTIGWLIAFVIFIGIEVTTMALTTIWFAGGALAAFFASLAGFPVTAQLVIFLLVSFVLLIFTRPFAIKYVNKSAVKTNAEGLVGKKARVISEINNGLSMGSAVVNGQEWTARAANDGMVLSEGEMVIIKEIRGVKLIVDRIQEGK